MENETERVEKEEEVESVTFEGRPKNTRQRNKKKTLLRR